MSTRLSHSREQLPVGQGGFHAGSVSFDGPPFTYVYDCGSERKKTVGREIENYVNCNDYAKLDILFLSHLDADHVNGIDQLLTLRRTETVVLPYLSPACRFYLIAKADSDGSMSGESLSLLCDPTRWLADRGVERVVYVTSSPPGDEPPNWTVPPRSPPSGQGVDLESELLPRGKVTDFSKRIGTIDWEKLHLGDTQPQPGRSRKKLTVQVVPCTQAIPLMCPATWPALTWQFITYVHPESSESLNHFKSLVRKLMPSRNFSLGSRFELNQQRLQVVLQNPRERKALKACYSAFQSNHNLVSMSLYSGPIITVPVDIQYRVEGPNWGRWFGQHEIVRRGSNIAVGWLGTGDSDFLNEERRIQFLHHYGSLADHISTLVLPHHGSKHNFHEDILRFGEKSIVAVGKRNKYGHPDAEVLARHNRPLLRTTEDAETCVLEHVGIEMLQ